MTGQVAHHADLLTALAWEEHGQFASCDTAIISTLFEGPLGLSAAQLIAHRFAAQQSCRRAGQPGRGGGCLLECLPYGFLEQQRGHRSSFQVG